MGNLYILATPIGNLNEVSKLLIDKLETLPILFCEDTRVITNLLRLLGIKNKPKLISYHKFSETKKSLDLINLLKSNDCGLISDAGYPSISDPGSILINQCHKHDIQVNVVNGPCAINHAISQSGFGDNGFIFIGFIPRNKNEIKCLFDKYLNLSHLPIVFFESVHRINQTIEYLKEFYPNNDIYVGRELSKKFEEYSISKIKNLDLQTTKGEFCLIVKPLLVEKNVELNSNQVINDIKDMLACGMKLKSICKYLAKKYNLKANDIYNEAISLKINDDE